MTDEVHLRGYQLKDTMSLAHPTHSFQAWRGDSLRFTFAHKSSPHDSSWEITDRNQAAAGTLVRHSIKADSLTLLMPDRPEVTIRQLTLTHPEWAIEYPDYTLPVRQTDDYTLPVFDKRGERTPHFIVSLPDGTELAAIRINTGRAGGSCSVHVAGRWSALPPLSLAVGILIRDFQFGIAKGAFNAATNQVAWDS